MEMYEKTVSSKPIFKGVIVDLRVDRVTLPNGAEAGREVVSHPGGVCVVPYHDDGTVTVVRQFRYPFGTFIWPVDSTRDPATLTPTSSWSWTGYPLKCCWSRPWTAGFRTPRPWPGC